MRAETFPHLSAHANASKRFLARHEMHVPTFLPEGPEAFSFVLYQSLGQPLLPGHRVELLENGRIFARMLEAIEAARHSVHVLVFIWRPSAPSDLLVEALTRKARAGVRCRVLVDPVGSEQISGSRDFDLQVERRLTEAGCEVHYYRLLAGRLVGRLLGRDHQKIVVVDGRVGFTGGFGIDRFWQGDGRKPDEWRDTHVRVEGPSVRQMQLAFAHGWQEAGGDLLAPEDFPAASAGPGGPVGPIHAAFIPSVGRVGITDADRLTRLVFAAARKRLWIANAYFTPPEPLLTLLERKRRAGVDVRVLMPGPHDDVRLARASQRSTYPRLLDASVRLWEYQPAMMHAKTVLVDDCLSVVGSINLDPVSLHKLGECALVVAERNFAAELARVFERDLEVSQEITPSRGGRTNPWRRLARRISVLAGGAG